jgi:CheY-like chemotaxis protein
MKNDMMTASLTDVSILCVDDYTDTLELLKCTLELHGARVIGAVSAEEALRVFSAHHPDILISDLMLPQDDGISLVRTIRRQSPRTAAIALTAISDSKVRGQAFDAGFDRYLVKPVDDYILIQTVSRLAPKAA